MPPVLAHRLSSHVRAKVARGVALRDQVATLAPDVHVFGHTHVPWDSTIDSVRYVQWPLGNPKEHADPSSVMGTGQVGTGPKGVQRASEFEG